MYSMFICKYLSAHYKTPVRTGSDRLSKVIFNHDFVKDIVINTLLDIPGNNDRIGNNEWSDRSRSDVVYEPVQSSLPIVVIEIPHHVNPDFL
ncbi:hypothetical protein BDA99DRAFT_560977 [Phascolomyces articulosus]|uniref:Uncharacterized protein n=1 Tax=Phascolomyces articulosus TaxID=60185 RepID=A0AAD5JY07_9FUNG|nr:hypothetical protein BDA99DRAFT_560977 [Phascolomyces articulosus]